MYEYIKEKFRSVFGTGPEYVFSAPGRTELSGNHTDHQHGKVLAAAVDLDILAATAVNGTGIIRIMSEGFGMYGIDTEDTEIRENEKNTPAALIRGVTAWYREKGIRISGFDAYVVSSVPSGSGLSSSAAFEVLCATAINHLFCNASLDAMETAMAGQRAENIYFGKPCGLMDQLASSMGGIVYIDFESPAVPLVRKINFDFEKANYAVCITDTHAGHSDLTGEYAAVTEELGNVSSIFGKKYVSEINESEFYSSLPKIREKAGDRAVLRAMHVIEENKRVAAQVYALENGDFASFLEFVRESGLSSFRLLQNIIPQGNTFHQEAAFTLALAEKILGGKGACRIHGGGFGGTVQAFVPVFMLEEFTAGMDAVLGTGSCRPVKIRYEGGIRIE